MIKYPDKIFRYLSGEETRVFLMESVPSPGGKNPGFSAPHRKKMYEKFLLRYLNTWTKFFDIFIRNA
ncbi:Uncharacterized protein dnm_059760 [Desulfonema magnum]|uniref:Uncharacterized protein n=1 Tax=Desulfonema magnum TaxID=45655 RepID=A0A975BQN4_9BACT|nr:Uncharacterized protein dnm_059760 [Desulfonema magnum]